MKSRRLQFSLLNLLLLITCTALALGIWRTHRKLLPLHEEINQLNEKIADLNRRINLEIGVLNIDNPSKMVVQPQLFTSDVFRQYRWRAYVPPGHVARFELELTEPGQNANQVSCGMLFEGQSIFEFNVHRPTVGEGWIYNLHAPNGSGCSGMPGPYPPWFVVAGALLRVPYRALCVGESADLFHVTGTDAGGNKVEVVFTVKLGVK